MQSKTDYVEGTTLQLELWGDHFANLEEKVADTASVRRDRLRRQLEAVKQKKRELKLRLSDAARRYGGPDWVNARRHLENAVDAFRSEAIEVYQGIRAS